MTWNYIAYLIVVINCSLSLQQQDFIKLLAIPSSKTANRGSGILYEIGEAENERILIKRARNTGIKKIERKSIPEGIVTCEWSSWTPAVTCSNSFGNNTNVQCSGTGRAFNQTRACIGGHNTATSQCIGPRTRELPCDICGQVGMWSSWSKCCANKPCFDDVIGQINRSNSARYRTLSSNCSSVLQGDSSCPLEYDFKGCIPKDGGRSFRPVNDDDGNEGVWNPFGSTVILVAFSVAALVMIGLIAFAGVRLTQAVRLRQRSIAQHVNNNLYDAGHNHSPSSGSPSNNITTLPVSMVRPSTIGRAIPSRLSVIVEGEEENASSDGDDKASDEIEQLNVLMEPAMDDNDDAIEYMDDVIMQFENEEQDLVEQEEEDETAKTDRDDFLFLNNFGWKPLESNTHCEVIRLKEPADDSEQVLSASAMSLASASLLTSEIASRDYVLMSSSSALSEDANSYLLDDVTHDELNLKKQQYSSLPDISKLRDNIPDIDVIITESDSQLCNETQFL